MSNEEFCKMDTEFNGELVDYIEQIKLRSFNGAELKEYVEHCIKFNNVDLGSVRLSLPSENDVKEQAKRIIIPYDGYKKDNAQRMIGFKQGAEWMRDKVKDNEA